jgi:hypothetical protein
MTGEIQNTSSDTRDNPAVGAATMPTPATESAYTEEDEASPWDTQPPPKPASLAPHHPFLQLKDQILAHCRDEISKILLTMKVRQHCSISQGVTKRFQISAPRANPNAALFACPFYLFNKKKHVLCLKQGGFADIDQVKRHLGAYHRTSHYCPTCCQTFKRFAEREDHIISRQCLPTPGERVDVVFDHHVDALSGQALGLTAEEDWKTIFRVIFADVAIDVDRISPYLPASAATSAKLTLEDLALVAREFWTENGESVVSKALQERGLLIWSDCSEERDLAAFHAMIEDELFENVIKRRNGWDTKGLGLEG